MQEAMAKPADDLDLKGVINLPAWNASNPAQKAGGSPPSPTSTLPSNRSSQTNMESNRKQGSEWTFQAGEEATD
jgi:hypothetical protein